jgi:hypothetical protein
MAGMEMNKRLRIQLADIIRSMAPRDFWGQLYVTIDKRIRCIGTLRNPTHYIRKTVRYEMRRALRAAPAITLSRDLVSPESPPWGILHKKDLLEALNDGLLELPTNIRHALQATFLGLEQTSNPRQTINYRKRRGLNLLRRRLELRGYHDPS